MALRRANGGGEVSLPADYVAQHVELAYATTAYRSQGRTTDTTHSLVAPTTTREVLYVSATRGRESNSLYIDTSFDPDPATGHDGVTSLRTAKDVLAGVLANAGADLSAHESLERAQLKAEDFGLLAAEYETLAQVAQQDRVGELLGRSGLEPERLEEIRQSPAYGPLLAVVRDAEARGLDVEETLPGLVAARSLDGAQDIATVIRDRIERWADANGSRRRTGSGLIAGLIPRAVGVTDTDMARGLQERAGALQRRARELAEHAIDQNPLWLRQLGVRPCDRLAAERWLEAVKTIAAYRERWNIEDDSRPLGSKVTVRSIEARNQRRLARAAVNTAIRVTHATGTQRPEVTSVAVGLTLNRGPEL
jgi:hypothetical protein